MDGSPEKKGLLRAAGRCSIAVASMNRPAGRKGTADKKSALGKHAKPERANPEDVEQQEPRAYRKVTWTSAQIVPPKLTKKIDILAEVRRAMELPLPVKQSFHQQAREANTKRWNACQPLSDEAKLAVDELLAYQLSTPGASPRGAQGDTPVGSPSSSLHETFLRTHSDRGTNLFSVGKFEEADDLGRQRMNYAKDLVAKNQLEDAEGMKVQDLFSSRIALLRATFPTQDSPSQQVNHTESTDSRCSSERGKTPVGAEADALKDYRQSVFGESEVFHDEGFRRLQRNDFQGSLEVLQAAWEIVDHEMLERDVADEEEISQIREKIEKAEEEKAQQMLLKPQSCGMSPISSRVSTMRSDLSVPPSENESPEIKMILLKNSERLKLERQQKISLGFDLAMVYARLKEWRKVDEICELILGFFAKPGELPDLPKDDEDKWIHFTIRRAVACAFLGKNEYPRCRAYLGEVLKLVPRHNRARRCLQCLNFLEEQFASEASHADLLAALEAIDI